MINIEPGTKPRNQGPDWFSVKEKLAVTIAHEFGHAVGGVPGGEPEDEPPAGSEFSHLSDVCNHLKQHFKDLERMCHIITALQNGGTATQEVICQWINTMRAAINGYIDDADDLADQAAEAGYPISALCSGHVPDPNAVLPASCYTK